MIIAVNSLRSAVMHDLDQYRGDSLGADQWMPASAWVYAQYYTQWCINLINEAYNPIGENEREWRVAACSRLWMELAKTEH